MRDEKDIMKILAETSDYDETPGSTLDAMFSNLLRKNPDKVRKTVYYPRLRDEIENCLNNKGNLPLGQAIDIACDVDILPKDANLAGLISAISSALKD